MLVDYTRAFLCSDIMPKTMGIMKMLKAISSPGGEPEFSDENEKLSHYDEIRDLLEHTILFIFQLRERYLDSTMWTTEDTIYSKVIVLKVEEVLQLAMSLDSHLEKCVNAAELLDDKRTRQGLQTHLGILRKMTTRAYTYICILERKKGKISRKFFRNMTKKGLFDHEDKDFANVPIKTDIAKIDKNMTEDDLNGLLMTKVMSVTGEYKTNLKTKSELKKTAVENKKQLNPTKPSKARTSKYPSSIQKILSLFS